MKDGMARRAAVPLLVELHVAPFDEDGTALHESPGDLLADLLIDPGEGRPGDIHPPGRFRMREVLVVGQSQGFILLVLNRDVLAQGHGDAHGLEASEPGRTAQLTVSFGSW